MNWEEAEEYLKVVESAYAETGSAGIFAVIHVIRPVRDRFNKGERTQELYDEIMGIQL
jgi:hypothetical protein